MSEFLDLVAMDDLADGCGLPINVGGRQIALFRRGDEVFAIDEMCTHAEASLCEGHLDGDDVVCPLHYAAFNLRTGEVTAPPAFEDIRTYQVRIQDGRVLVKVD
jgi:3-phenylpropionate/trans-cinnamate dioxygenase ferredoxin subunit